MQSLKKYAMDNGIPFAEVLNERNMNLRNNVEAKRRLALTDVTKRVEQFNTFERIMGDFKGKKDGDIDIHDLFSAYLSHSKKLKSTGLVNVERAGSVIQRRITLPFEEYRLKHPETWARALKGDTDLELKILKAHYGEKVKWDVGEEELFNTWKKSNSIELHEMRSQNLMIAELENRAVKGKNIGKKIAKLTEDEYVSKANQLVDFQRFKTWDDDLKISRIMNAEEIDAKLRSDYRKFSGKEDTDLIKSETPFDYLTGDRKAIQAEKGRRYTFKNAEAELDWRKSFGQDGSLLSNHIRDLESKGKFLGAMEVLGSNPRGNLEVITNQVLKDLRKKGFGDSVDKYLRRGYNNPNTLRRMLDEAMGIRPIYSSPIIQSLKTFLDMKLLSKAIQSTGTDFAFGGVFGNLLTGKSQAGIMTKLLADTFMKIKDPNLRRAFGAKFGVMMEGLLDDVSSLRFTGEVLAESVENKPWWHIYKYRNKIAKATLLPQQSTATRQAFSEMGSMRLAELAQQKISFDVMAKTDPALHKWLQRQGMTTKEWDFLSLHGVTTDTIDGISHSIMSPNHIYDMPDEIIGDFFKVKDKVKINDIRNKLDMKVASFLESTAEIASPTPNARTRAFLNTAFGRDSFAGELLKTMLQYKSFGFSVYNTMDAIGRAGGGGWGSYKALGTTVGLTSVFGAAVLLSKDITSNRDPRHRFKNPKSFALDALLQGGSGGTFMDVGGAPLKGRNPVRDIMGPLIGGAMYDTGEMLAKVGTSITQHGDMPSKNIGRIPFLFADYASKQLALPIPIPGAMQISQGYLTKEVLEFGMTQLFPDEMRKKRLRNIEAINDGKRADKIIGFEDL
jgi:hypothetical protein